MTGTKITMAELEARAMAKLRIERAERRAYEATPEGAAEKAEREAHHLRMVNADARFAQENPPDHRENGRDAAIAGRERMAPGDLNEEDADEWLAGWDEEGEDEE